MVLSDFLLMIAGIGCFVSTTITLLVRLPSWYRGLRESHHCLDFLSSVIYQRGGLQTETTDCRQLPEVATDYSECSACNPPNVRLECPPSEHTYNSPYWLPRRISLGLSVLSSRFTATHFGGRGRRGLR